MKYLTEKVFNYSGRFLVQLNDKHPFQMNLFFNFEELGRFCNIQPGFVDSRILTAVLASLTIYAVCPMSIFEVKKFPRFPAAISPFLDDEDTLGDYLLAEIDFIDARIEEHCAKIEKIEATNLQDFANQVESLFGRQLNLVNSIEPPRSGFIFKFLNYKKPSPNLHFFARRLFNFWLIAFAFLIILMFLVKYF